jgi:protein-tyrosine phosphatase
VIDLHTHVLPGLDDGAMTLSDSLAMVKEAVELGVTTIVATPHVREDYPTTPEQMLRALEALRRAVAASGLAVEVLPGGEIGFDRLESVPVDELRAFVLGGASDVLLVEVPYDDWPHDLLDHVQRLARAGLRCLIAHPERNGWVQDTPGLLEPLVRFGALVQITAGSLAGRFGRRPARASKDLLAMSLVHVVATDSHGARDRGEGLRKALAGLRDPALANWLTVDVPQAILGARPAPPRPEPQLQRRGQHLWNQW